MLHPVGGIATEKNHPALIEKTPPSWQVQQIVGQIRADLDASSPHHKLRIDATHHFGQFDASNLNPGYSTGNIYSGNQFMLLDPTTLLTPTLFNIGIDLLSGAFMTNTESVLFPRAGINLL